jgi:mRNA interferase MazF
MKKSIEIDTDLLEQIATVAEQLGITSEAFITQTLQKNLHVHQTKRIDRRRIKKGDIFWVQLEGMIPHPYLVLQDDIFNNSRLDTVIMCALTTNLKRVSIPGTLLLDEGEANLPKQSLVEMTKLNAVPKANIGEYIGSLHNVRLHQISYLMRFMQTSLFDHFDEA